ARVDDLVFEISTKGAFHPGNERLRQTARGFRKASAMSLPVAASPQPSLLVLLDVLHDIPNGTDLLRVLVGDFHLVLFLERHYHLDDIERIRAEILDERGLRRDFFFSPSEVLADDLPPPRFGVFRRRFSTCHVRVTSR